MYLAQDRNDDLEITKYELHVLQETRDRYHRIQTERRVLMSWAVVGLFFVLSALTDIVLDGTSIRDWLFVALTSIALINGLLTLSLIRNTILFDRNRKMAIGILDRSSDKDAMKLKLWLKHKSLDINWWKISKSTYPTLLDLI